MRYTFDAFMSYSSKDRARVNRVVTRLTNAGYSIWRDTGRIRAGQNIVSQIRDGLGRSRVLLRCHLKNSHDSRWVQEEFDAMRFQEIQVGIVKTIVLRLDDTPLPVDIAHKKYIDFSGKTDRGAAWRELIATLDDSAGAVIAHCASNLLRGEEIEESAAKLRDIAIRRGDSDAILTLRNSLEAGANSHKLVDSVASCLGQIACATEDAEMLSTVQRSIESGVISANDLVVDKLAYTVGEIAMTAQLPSARDWALKYIETNAETSDPSINRRFTYTKRRIASQS